MPRYEDYLDEEELTPLIPDEPEEDDYQGGMTGRARPGFESTAISVADRKPDGLDASGYVSAIDRLTKRMGERPATPKPKWWQRLLAGAAGAGIGYVNAGGRTRPIDPRGVTEAILAPGYRQKVSDWQRGVEEAKAAATGEGAKLQAQEAIERIRATQDQRASQAEANKARKAYYEHLMNQPPKQPAPATTYEGRLVRDLDNPDPQVRAEAQRKLDAMKEKPTPRDSNPNEYALAMSAAQGDQTARSALDLIRKQHPKEVDPLVHELRQQRLDEVRQKASEATDQRKINTEKQILQERDKEVGAILQAGNFETEDDVHRAAVDPTSTSRAAALEVKRSIQAINRKYAPRLQAAQQNYASSVRARGGAADDYTVDPDTLEYKPGGAQAGVNPGAPKVSLAPEAVKRLKPGVVTTFGNGQKWTIGPDGKPKQV